MSIPFTNVRNYHFRGCNSGILTCTLEIWIVLAINALNFVDAFSYRIFILEGIYLLPSNCPSSLGLILLASP